MSSKKFQELNLSDGFLFPAALEDPVTCRLVLECMIEEPISDLSVKVEYTKLYNSEFKCIRLDVFSKDTVTNVSYNLEMQNQNKYNLPLRSRYYQAQIDVANLEPGDEYQDLKPLYVIFICNFDPFGEELYRYTFSMQCEEKSFPLNDGVKRIFFNTDGKNSQDVPSILLDFFGYLNDSTDTYIEQNPCDKVKEIHGRIKILKENRSVEARYMHYLYVDEVIANLDKKIANLDKEIEEKNLYVNEMEAKAKEAEVKTKEAEAKTKEARNMIVGMIFDYAEALGSISKDIHEHISNEEDIKVLKSIYKAVVSSDSVKQFEEKIANL